MLSRLGNSPQIPANNPNTAKSTRNAGPASVKESSASTAARQETMSGKLKTKNNNVKAQNEQAKFDALTNNGEKVQQVGDIHAALPPGKPGENAKQMSGDDTGDFPKEVKASLKDDVNQSAIAKGHKSLNKEAAANASKTAQTLTINQPPVTEIQKPVDTPSKGADKGPLNEAVGAAQDKLDEVKGAAQDKLNELKGAAQGQMTGSETPIGDLNVGGVVQGVNQELRARLGGITDEVTISGGVYKNDSGMAARISIGGTNLGNTGLAGVLSGGISVLKKADYLEDGRILQVKSKQADISVGVTTGADAVAPVSVSIGIDRSYDVAYAKKPGPGEDLISVQKENPPSRSKIQNDPTILKEGDEIAFRGMLKLSLSAGVVDPHSNVKVSVGGSITNEFVTSISRLDGEPPKFKVHVEPGNRSIDVNAAVGWGPFAITGELGKASTVHYNFEMSETAVKTFMETGKLPKLPDPQKYLGSIDKLSEKKQEKLLKAFDHIENGVQLTSMGATKSSEASIEASATAAKVKTSSGRSKEVYIREGEVLRQDVHTMSESHSSMFTSEKSTTLSLTQGDRYTLDDQKKFKKSYVGLDANFTVGDANTTKKELTNRIQNANKLLGPNAPQLHLPDESSKSWGNSSLEIKAKITPEVLGKLTEIGGEIKEREAMSPEQLKNRKIKGSGNDPDAMMKFMELEFKVDSKDVKAMLKDLHEISKDPELAGKPDDIKRKQGIRMAGFLASGPTSVVNNDELKRIATVQRLVGPEHNVVTVGFNTDVHMNNLQSLNLDSYLHDVGRSGLSTVKDKLASLTGSAPDERGSWTHFNTGAQKLKGLEQVRQDLVGDQNIDPKGKALLLKKVDEYMDALDVELSAQLNEPRGRTKIMAGLLKAGSVVPSEFNSIYKSPETMYQDVGVREEFMDMVLQASLRDMDPEVPESHEEIASLIKSIANSEKGSMGINEAFKLLNSAKEFGPDFQAKVVNKVGAEPLAKMVPNMTNDQKMTLLGEIAPLAFPASNPASKVSVDKIKGAIAGADKISRNEFSKISDKLKSVETNLEKLKTKQTLLLDVKGKDKYTIKNKEVASHFKDGYKDLSVPMDKVESEISSSFLKLGEKRHLILNQRKDGLNQQIDGLLGGIDRMDKDQRLELLTEVIKPSQNYDSLSNSVLQRLVDSSSSENNFELHRFAQEVKARITKLEKDPPSRLTMFPSDQKVMHQDLQTCLTNIQLKLR